MAVMSEYGYKHTHIPSIVDCLLENIGVPALLYFLVLWPLDVNFINFPHLSSEVMKHSSFSVSHNPLPVV